MVFFREVQESTFYSLQLCSMKGFLSLTNRNTEVFSALYNQYWSIPFFNMIYRIESRVCLLCYSVIFFPISTTKIPVGKEKFFSCAIHALCVENTVMGDKCFEAIIMNTG